MIDVDILLIDDDDDEFIVLIDALKSFSYSVRCVYANGAKMGLDMLINVRPKIVLVDMNMPGIKGTECIKMIKSKSALSDLNVMLYSVSINENLQENALTAGANYCFQKPDSITELTKKLSYFI